MKVRFVLIYSQMTENAVNFKVFLNEKLIVWFFEIEWFNWVMMGISFLI
jgi:hypothetical protein